MIELTVPSWARLRSELGARLRRDQADWTIGAGLFVLAVILRVSRLVEIPPGLHGDEAWTGLRAHDILHGATIAAFDPLHGLGQPAGMEYLTAFFVAIFGNSALTIRLPMALVGAATIPMTYGLVRVLNGRIAAVIAALLLAVMSWHLHYSRIALPPISAPFFEVLTCFVFALAMRSRARWQFALAGLALGLGVYSYSSYPVFMLAFALFVAYWLVTQVKDIGRELMRNVGLMFLVAVFAAIPMLSYIATNSDTYFTYPRGISLFNSPEYEQAGTLLDRGDVIADAGRDYVRRLVFDAAPDFSDATGDGPMLNMPMAFLLGLGMVYAIWRWRQPLAFMSLLVIFIVPWSGILTVGGGIIRRTAGVTPFIAVLAALPLAELIRVTERGPPALRRAAYLLPFGMIAIIGTLGLQFYYGDFPGSEPARAVFSPELVGASNYMADLPDGTVVYFYSALWSINYETQRYLAPDAHGEDRSAEFSASRSVNFETDREQNVAYVLLDPYIDRLAEIQRLYPGGTAYERTNNDGRPEFSAYFLPGLQPGETPSAPLPTFVPTPTLTPMPGGDARDRQRQSDLLRVQEALEEYQRAHGSYPDNNGEIQTLCSYQDYDVGCDLEEQIPSIPQDPLGDPNRNGYFYGSNGATYAVYAYRETEALPACPDHPDHLARFLSILCVTGP